MDTHSDTAYTPLAVLNAASTTLLQIATSRAIHRLNAPHARAIIPPIIKAARCTKRRSRSTIRNTHLVQKKTNYKHTTSFKPSLPEVPDVQSKPRTRSYAEAVSKNNPTFLNSHTYEKSFTKFISDLSTLINPLITLLTAVINKLLIP
jgi:hypothetical protein